MLLLLSVSPSLLQCSHSYMCAHVIQQARKPIWQLTQQNYFLTWPNNLLLFPCFLKKGERLQHHFHSFMADHDDSKQPAAGISEHTDTSWEEQDLNSESLSREAQIGRMSELAKGYFCKLLYLICCYWCVLNFLNEVSKTFTKNTKAKHN